MQTYKKLLFLTAGLCVGQNLQGSKKKNFLSKPFYDKNSINYALLQDPNLKKELIKILLKTASLENLNKIREIREMRMEFIDEKP